MTRVRRYGKLSSRAVRAVACLRSAVAVVALWWRMPWQDKMWPLWATELTGLKNAALQVLRRYQSELQPAAE